jgi:hypothetical protein
VGGNSTVLIVAQRKLFVNRFFKFIFLYRVRGGAPRSRFALCGGMVAMCVFVSNYLPCVVNRVEDFVFNRFARVYIIINRIEDFVFSLIYNIHLGYTELRILSLPCGGGNYVICIIRILPKEDRYKVSV